MPYDRNRGKLVLSSFTCDFGCGNHYDSRPYKGFFNDGNIDVTCCSGKTCIANLENDPDYIRHKEKEKHKENMTMGKVAQRVFLR